MALGDPDLGPGALLHVGEDLVLAHRRVDDHRVAVLRRLRRLPALVEEGRLERRVARLVHLDLRRERRAALGPDPIGQRRDVRGGQAAHPRQVLEQPEALGQALEDEHGVVPIGAEPAPGHMPWTRPPAPPPTCWTA